MKHVVELKHVVASVLRWWPFLLTWLLATEFWAVSCFTPPTCGRLVRHLGAECHLGGHHPDAPPRGGARGSSLSRARRAPSRHIHTHAWRRRLSPTVRAAVFSMESGPREFLQNQARSCTVLVTRGGGGAGQGAPRSRPSAPSSTGWRARRPIPASSPMPFCPS